LLEAAREGRRPGPLELQLLDPIVSRVMLRDIVDDDKLPSLIN
jgi:hypothetical protein